MYPQVPVADRFKMSPLSPGKQFKVNSSNFSVWQRFFVALEGKVAHLSAARGGAAATRQIRWGIGLVS